MKLTTRETFPVAFSPPLLQPQNCSLELKMFLFQMYLHVHLSIIYLLLGSITRQMQIDNKSTWGEVGGGGLLKEMLDEFCWFCFSGKEET